MSKMLATVTVASPLQVRIDGDAATLPARVMSRADAYAPALNARVIVEFIGRTLYVMGGA